MSNSTLKKARKDKNDEFYTQLTDIEKELRHYRDKFEDKVIYSNCDDPWFSNFVRYFIMNFTFLKIKKFIATYYNKGGHGGKLIVTADNIDRFLINGDYKQTVINDSIEELDGDGDFRSDECVEILKTVDIVVTNPPFSLFREFVGLMMNEDKKFSCIGNTNAITYKEIFPLIKQNQLWLGYIANKTLEFHVPDSYEKFNYIDELGGKVAKVPSIAWFTNIDTTKRHKPIDLYCNYYGNENSYPKYDNYNAINVDKVSEIPDDYGGVMGVPITFLDKWDPDQFEIIGLGTSKDNYSPQKQYIHPVKYINMRPVNGGQVINSALVYEVKSRPNKTHYSANNAGWLIQPYARILIQHKL